MTTAPIHAELERIVVFCPSWVGDVVMATPVLRAIDAHCPNATIIGIVRPGHEKLLAGSPWFDQIISARNTGMLDPWRLAKQLRKLNAQAGLLLPNSFRSALTLRFSSVPIRVGYGRDGRSWLLTHPIDPPQHKVPHPTVAYYSNLAQQAMAIGQPNQTMQLFTTDEEHDAAEKMLHDVSSPFVLLNPGASKPAKRWSPERFAAVADALAESHKLAVVINAAPDEHELVEQIVQRCSAPAVNLASRGGTLGSLKAVIQRASLMITNDTGPRHMAAALGTPMVSLFGPTDHRWTALAGVRERVLLAEPFLPVELTADAHAQACVIDRIPTSDVIAAARALLGPPRA